MMVCVEYENVLKIKLYTFLLILSVRDCLEKKILRFPGESPKNQAKKPDFFNDFHELIKFAENGFWSMSHDFLRWVRILDKSV